LKDLEKLTNQSIPVVSDHPFSTSNNPQSSEEPKIRKSGNIGTNRKFSKPSGNFGNNGNSRNRRRRSGRNA